MSESTAHQRLCFESERQFRALRSALVVDGYERGREQGAFLFASPAGNGALRIVDTKVLSPEDFTIQTAHYLELQENVLQKMILRAHQTNTALVEAHSHPFAEGPRVRFSPLDCEGLADIGPHVSWRLPGRPYVALVLGWSEFDSLYWEGGQRAPRGYVDLLVCGRVHCASRESERYWRRVHG